MGSGVKGLQFQVWGVNRNARCGKNTFPSKTLSDSFSHSLLQAARKPNPTRRIMGLSNYKVISTLIGIYVTISIDTSFVTLATKSHV